MANSGCPLLGPERGRPGRTLASTLIIQHMHRKEAPPMRTRSTLFRIGVLVVPFALAASL